MGSTSVHGNGLNTFGTKTIAQNLKDYIKEEAAKGGKIKQDGK